jgi:hypothetical protein
MIRLEDDALVGRVKSAVSELVTAGEQLRGLACVFDGFAGLNARADAEELRQAAIGVRAAALQALLTVTAVLGSSERLSSVAVVLDRAQPEQS